MTHPETRNITPMGLDLLFCHFKIWRWLRGGQWARSTKKADIGRGFWIPYIPGNQDAFKKLVAQGEFLCEDYR